MMQKTWKMTETVEQNKNLCFTVFWMEVALALEGLYSVIVIFQTECKCGPDSEGYGRIAITRCRPWG